MGLRGIYIYNHCIATWSQFKNETAPSDSASPSSSLVLFWNIRASPPGRQHALERAWILLSIKIGKGTQRVSLLRTCGSWFTPFYGWRASFLLLFLGLFINSLQSWNLWQALPALNSWPSCLHFECKEPSFGTCGTNLQWGICWAHACWHIPWTKMVHDLSLKLCFFTVLKNHRHSHFFTSHWPCQPPALSEPWLSALPPMSSKRPS